MATKKIMLVTVISMCVIHSISADTTLARPKVVQATSTNLTNARTDLVIRVVDTNELAAKTQAGAEGRNAIEQKELQLRQEMQREAQKLEQMTAEYNSKKDMLSDDARQKQEMELIKLRRSYENMAQSNKEALQMTAMQEQDKLIKSIVDSSKEYAIENKIDVVVDKNSGSVIYSSEKAECTGFIVKIMDKQHEHKIQLAQSKKQETTTLAANKTGPTKRS